MRSMPTARSSIVSGARGRDELASLMSRLVVPAVVAACVSFALTRLLLSPRWRLAVIDHPTERSLRVRPTPRTGGLGIMGGIAAGVLVLALSGGLPPWAWWTLGCAAAIAVVSFCDDRAGLSPFLRLPLHLAAAAALVIGGGLLIGRIDVPALGAIPLGASAAAVTIVLLMWMANLYNFMDGMDGLAGGMAVVGFGFLAAIGLLQRDGPVVALSLTVMASAAGFLVFNVPPARIFMGDVGSVPLGLLAGALAVRATQAGASVWVPLLVFSPFVVDATIVFLRRLIRGEKVWQAHREHDYQRLVLAGWGRRRTLIAEYGVMIGSGLTAVLYLQSTPPVRLTLLVLWTIVYTLLHLG